MRCNGLGRLRYETKIGFSIFVERRRHADNDGVHVRQHGKVCGSAKVPPERGLDLSGGNSIDVRTTGAQSCDLVRVDVKAGHSKLFFRVEEGKRQAHITEADYAYSRLTSINSGFQL